jgi:hypothetical protein
MATDFPIRDPEQIRRDCARMLRAVQVSGHFLPRHHAKRALQAASPLREADAVRVVRVHAVILLLGLDADVLQPFGNVPAGPADLGIAVLLEQRLGDGPGPLEDQAGVDAVEVPPVGRFDHLDGGAVPEGDLVGVGAMVGCDPHEGDVRQLAVELQEEDFQTPPWFGMGASAVVSMQSRECRGSVFRRRRQLR